MHPEFHVRQTEKRFKTYVKIKYPSTLWQMLGAGDGDTRSNIAAKLKLTEHASSFVNPNNQRSPSCCSSKIPRFVYRNSFFKRLTKQSTLWNIRGDDDCDYAATLALSGHASSLQRSRSIYPNCTSDKQKNALKCTRKLNIQEHYGQSA